MKIAVIGTGGTGAAALRFLARSGRDVTGYERFSIGHAMGSSHGPSRLIRRTYPDPFHTRLMDDAYRLWNELDEEHGGELFVRCGGITFGPPDDPAWRNTRDVLAEEGIRHEILDRTETARRFPGIDIGEGASAIHQADSGFLRADRCVKAQIDAAVALGARLREHTAVVAIEERGDKVWISTDGDTEAFDRVIVTAGPWIGRLLPDLGLPLRTALRQAVHLAVRDGSTDHSPERFPVWIEHPSDFYGFPSDGVIAGVKVASHHAGIDFDPSRPDRPLMEEALEKVREHALKRLPGLSGRIVSATSCLYTITPDERFIVDFTSPSRRIAVCSGCSGHGFKFTVLLGKIAARMVCGPDPIRVPSEWSASRFA